MVDYPHGDIPAGMREDAAQTWPPKGLIDSYMGDMYDFELRLGESTPIPHEPAAMEQARLFRDVLGLFCSGVTVITTDTKDGPVGMTCQSFSSVSLDPPLVLFCPAKTSRTWPYIQRAGHFCVNFLAGDQEELSNRMATRGADKFAGVTWSKATTGAPLLDGVLGYVDCTVHAVHEAGDHYIVVGLVQELGFGEKAPADQTIDPLLFYRGKYRTTK